MKVSGVYVIECRPTKQVYVGSGASIAQRWSSHRSRLRAGIHHSKKLQAAWIRFGAAAFSFAIVETADPEKLIEREQFWIDVFRASGDRGFNVLPYADNNRGRRLSPETKAKISAALKGRRVSPERREELMAALRIAWAAPPSPETIAMRAAGFRGPHSEEAKAKLRAIAIGRRPSPETKRKLSLAMIRRRAHEKEARQDTA